MFINDFTRQRIQAETKVHSKLIVPLLDLLGYPNDFSAENPLCMGMKAV